MLQTGGDRTIVGSYVESLTEFARGSMGLHPSYRSIDLARASQFLRYSCPYNCSGYGTCSAEGDMKIKILDELNKESKK